MLYTTIELAYYAMQYAIISYTVPNAPEPNTLPMLREDSAAIMSLDWFGITLGGCRAYIKI